MRFQQLRMAMGLLRSGGVLRGDKNEDFIQIKRVMKKEQYHSIL